VQEPQTFDVSDPSRRFWTSGHRLRASFATTALALIVGGITLVYLGVMTPFGGPGTITRDLGQERILAGAYITAAGVAILLLLWLGARIIVKVSLSRDEVAVHMRNPRTQFDFPYPTRRRWERLEYPIRIRDYSSSDRADLANVPYVLSLGPFHRRQSGGIDRATFDALVDRTRLAGMTIQTDQLKGRAVTVILRTAQPISLGD